MDEDRKDPATRYGITGSFDEEAHESDLVAFPDCFDINGWPLFGDYDPYSLTHPITGESWHLSPRVPEGHERGSDYESWYFIAMTFLSISSSGRTLLKAMRARKTAFQEAADCSVHKASSPFAVLSNSKEMLRLERLLKPRLAARKLTAEFLLYWGELTAAHARFEAAIDESIETAKPEKAKSAQIKWLLHARRQHKGHLTSKQSNDLLKDHVFRIASGDAEPPIGFTREWFQDACGRSADNKRFVRDFPESLKRPGSQQYRQGLLRSHPDEDPKIPPIPQSPTTSRNGP